jgi:16S rRNA (cytosine1402-N4)-methyltransferase
MSEIDPIHIPILKEEIINYFKTTPHTFLLDGTAGEGGHSNAILEIFQTSKLVILDRDPVMLERALLRNKSYRDRIIGINVNFSEFSISSMPPEYQSGFDCILLDFGISMYHLKKSGKGFSFIGEEFLDMRLSPDSEKTAQYILNFYKEDKLLKIFLEYGEENWSKKIVEGIVTKRRKYPFTTTKELASLIEAIIPRKFWPPKAHPAFRIFQALRIEVNDELSHIEKGLVNLIPLLKENGIICCISFHSLEDRIVKTVFKQLDKDKELEILTKKPILPSEIEIFNNPAARSAKLRVARKTRVEGLK